MATENPAPAARATHMDVEIGAPVDAVWKALTDGEELTRWFPLEARVETRPGGKIWLSWGPSCEGAAEITVCEPLKNFAWREPSPFRSPGAPEFLLIEWTLESRGGKTIVRLVHSGFISGEDWENEYYDSTNYGWGFMLANLRHYLQRHPGRPRVVAWPRRQAALAREAACERLLAPGGLFVAGARELRPGRRYSLETSTGERFEGRVEFLRPPRGFCLTVESLHDALFWVTMEGAPGKLDVQLWLSAYGLSQNDADAFAARWQTVLERLFPRGSSPSS
jgi:uncharacterized protein YndB with AHSA1/START domain